MADDSDEGGDGLFGGLFTSDVQHEHQTFHFATHDSAAPISVQVECVHHDNQYLAEFVSRTVWPSAEAVAAVIARDPVGFFSELSAHTAELVKQPSEEAPQRLPVSLCELGSGTGLCGLAAAHFVDRTVLTDGEDPSIDVLRQSVTLNQFDLGADVHVERLLWGLDHPEDLAAVREASAGDGFDVIIGTDVVYREYLIRPMLESARQLLKPTGVFYLANHFQRIGQLQKQVSEHAESVGLVEERRANIGAVDEPDKQNIYVSVFTLKQ